MAVGRHQIEVGDLRTQSRLHLLVHLVTRLHQLDGQVHVVPRQPVVGPQGQGPWQEANQVVLEEPQHREEQRRGQERKEGGRVTEK